VKIQYVSDVHGQTKFVKPDADADVLVVAGDWCDGPPDLKVLFQWPVPVVYVLGNHEHYQTDADDCIDVVRRKTLGTNVHFLEQDTWTYQGVRFVGCTGWTDMAHLHPWVVIKAWETMSDFRKIGAERWLRSSLHRTAFMGALRKLPLHNYESPMLHPLIVNARHVQARQFIAQTLATPFSGPTVVVTHHPPSPLGLRHAGRWLPEPTPDMDLPGLAAAFPKAGWHRLGTYASRMDDLIREGKPDLWIHGHIHRRMQYYVYDTPVLVNALGYNAQAQTASINLPGFPWWQKREVLHELSSHHSSWLRDWVGLALQQQDIPRQLWAPHAWRLHQEALDEAYRLGGGMPPPSSPEDALTYDFWAHAALQQAEKVV
jgi:Icc-related predicted phosphoesterase